MEWIKKFENFDNLSKLEIEQFEDEVQDFCEVGLAYLLDDENIDLMTYFKKSNTSVYVTVYKKSVGDDDDYYSYDEFFLWSEVKDYLEPFFILLSKEYQILDNVIEFDEYTAIPLIVKSVDRLSELKGSLELSGLSFEVKRKITDEVD